jgi:hypothetical protein
VTILPRGKIDKGGFGTDKVSNFQQIIGATNKTNTVDASTADSGSSLDVNLANNSLKVNIPGITSQEFEVLNFVNVISGANNDRIFGGNVNSKLTKFRSVAGLVPSLVMLNRSQVLVLPLIQLLVSSTLFLALTILDAIGLEKPRNLG